jgi:hypothetical protein
MRDWHLVSLQAILGWIPRQQEDAGPQPCRAAIVAVVVPLTPPARPSYVGRCSTRHAEQKTVLICLKKRMQLKV